MSDMQMVAQPQTNNPTAVNPMVCLPTMQPAQQNRLPRYIFTSPSAEQMRERAQNEGCDI
jgi:hypothetical protein